MMKAVTRDENGTYYLNAKLANTMLGVMLTWALGVAGYMVVWNKDDAAWKAAQTANHAALCAQVGNLNATIGKLEERINTGILPIAEERIQLLDKRLDKLEGKH